MMEFEEVPLPNGNHHQIDEVDENDGFECVLRPFGSAVYDQRKPFSSPQRSGSE